MDPLMTVQEAARYLNISYHSLYKLVQQGRIPASKVGKHWRFKREFLDDWLAKQLHSEQKRILVVDDDQRVRDYFVEAIRRHGYQVVTATDGDEAVTTVKEEGPFDLIFLDVLMPRMNGVDALKGIRAHDPQAMITLVTGYADHALVADALQLGPFVVLRKPVQIKDIDATLKMLPVG